MTSHLSPILESWNAERGMQKYGEWRMKNGEWKMTRALTSCGLSQKNIGFQFSLSNSQFRPQNAYNLRQTTLEASH